MARRGSNVKVVPECQAAIDQMKYEIAAELGLTQPVSGDYGSEMAGELGSSAAATYGVVQWDSIATRDAGAIGGTITRRLVQRAEEVLRGL